VWPINGHPIYINKQTKVNQPKLHIMAPPYDSCSDIPPVFYNVSVFPSYAIPTTTFIFFLNTTYVILSLIAFKYYQNTDNRLRARPFFLTGLTGIGTILIGTVVCIRDWYGRDKFPCDAYLWLEFLFLLSFLSPIIIKLYVAVNLHHYQDLLLRVRDFDVKKVGETIRPRTIPKLLFQKQRIASTTNPFNKNYRGNTGGAIIIDTSTTTTSTTTTTSPNINNTTVDELTRDLISDFLLFKERSSSKMILISLSIIFIPVFILFLVLWLIDNRYRRDCVGCELSLSEQICYIIICICFGIICTYKIRQLRNVDDPLGFQNEVKMAFIPVAIGVAITMLLSLFDVGQVHSFGIFNWGWLLILNFSYAFFCGCPYQIILVKLDESKSSEIGRDQLMLILQDAEKCALFENHLRREFASESLLCWQAINSWKTRYHELEPGFRQKKAQKIFDDFIKPGKAPFEVNISARTLSILVPYFGSMSSKMLDDMETNPTTTTTTATGGGGGTIPIDLFDDLMAELEELMKKGSLIRFLHDMNHNNRNNNNSVVVSSPGHYNFKFTKSNNKKSMVGVSL
jgi:hypothetical protein